MNLELKKAIDQISKDKGLDRDMLVDTLEDAVRTSVIRKYGENIDVEVSYSDDTGKSRSTSSRSSLTTWPIPIPKIDIEKARELDPSVQLRRRNRLPPQGDRPRAHRGPVRQAGDHPAYARRRTGTHL